MRKSLRRSCNACAKAKHSCDLRTPKCSRCVKRKCDCQYANEPLTSTSARLGGSGNDLHVPQALKAPKVDAGALIRRRGDDIATDLSDMSMSFEAHMLDPFDSYPSTNLPRLRVQNLMQHFLSNIAFNYYPLDLNPSSNPFVTSWWPLALTDPTLFHVTLQTASLDDELRSMKGFAQSELLMKDSISLLRHKIQDQSLAFQDATMNAVVILAAIEHGKGNLQVSKLHIDGVKRMVNVRGGLAKVKTTSLLTARMVPWVSMLVTGSPQFETQDDFGRGHGISAIHQWQFQFSMPNEDPKVIHLDALGIDPILGNIVNRLRSIFVSSLSTCNPVTLSTTDLHDLTCFVLHRLLALPPFTGVDSISASTSESLRYAISAYMFIVHGATYYSHDHVLHTIIIQLKNHLDLLLSCAGSMDSLLLWLLSVGAVASAGMNEGHWFRGKAVAFAVALAIQCWDDVETHLERVLWLGTRSRVLFQQAWEQILTGIIPIIELGDRWS